MWLNRFGRIMDAGLLSIHPSNYPNKIDPNFKYARVKSSVGGISMREVSSSLKRGIISRASSTLSLILPNFLSHDEKPFHCDPFKRPLKKKSTFFIGRGDVFLGRNCEGCRLSSPLSTVMKSLSSNCGKLKLRLVLLFTPFKSRHRK